MPTTPRFDNGISMSLPREVCCGPVPPRDIERYGRQMLLPWIGASGQKAISQGSVFVVGVGGLGSPCSMYLASSGVGSLGLMDFDVVDVSNLHRQIAHRETSAGSKKSESAATTCRELNSAIEINVFDEKLSEVNALEILRPYDVVVDCTDNPEARYLVNDACVLLKKPLVSASVSRMEGQLSVYCYGCGTNCPCYRCLAPRLPPSESVMRCRKYGVLGPAAGVMGSLQAIQALKTLVSIRRGEAVPGLMIQKMLMFDAMSFRFRVAKLRPRNANCSVCGENPSITSLRQEVLPVAAASEVTVDPVSVEDVLSDDDCVLIDVRASHEFEMVSLSGSINIPESKFFEKSVAETLLLEANPGRKRIFLLCWRGHVSSSLAVKLSRWGFENVRSIEAGLDGWRRTTGLDLPAM